MTLPPNRDGREVAEQIDAFLDGDLSPADIERLRSWLAADFDHLRMFAREAFFHRELREMLLAQADVACLEQLDKQAEQPAKLGFIADLLPSDARLPFRPFLVLAMLAMVTAGSIIGLAVWRGGQGQDSGGEQSVARAPAANDAQSQLPNDARVAQLTRVWHPVWADPQDVLTEWSPLGEGRVVDLAGGQAEVFFDSGVQLILQGPVRFQVTGPMSGRVFHGNVTARVGEHAKGFALTTAIGKVIDLGTEFALSVQRDGETEVVVFDGAVNLEYAQDAAAGANADDPNARQAHLIAGQAVRIRPDGTERRIVNVNSQRFPRAALGPTTPTGFEPVIRSVSDTIRAPGAGPFYEIVPGGMGEDAQAYVDRKHQWNGVDKNGMPSFLLGADYVRTFNDDKRRQSIALTVELDRAADLYVFWDDRAAVPPEWLRQGFAETGMKIGLDEAAFYSHRWRAIQNPSRVNAVGPGNDIDVIFSVWHRKVTKAGVIQLGAPGKLDAEPDDGIGMYGIAAVAAPSEPEPHTETP